MRRMIIISILVATMGVSALSAYADDRDSDVVAAIGSGGYSSGTWSFSAPNGDPTGLNGVIVSSDTTVTVPLPLSPTVPPNSPPPPTVDPTCPLCTVFSVLNTICIPEPQLCPDLISLLPTFYSPVVPESVSLSGTGTFSCGSGTLSGSGQIGTLFVSEPDFSLTWTATFSNGLGTVAGTATADCFENNAECGQVKTLGGFIFINDGSLIPGRCDDSAGNSQVAALLTISP